MTPTLERALAYIPDGSCTLSKRPKAWPSGGPTLALSGAGPYIIGDDHQRYIDWVCALGALTVGHTHPRIVEAVVRQVHTGSIYSLPSVLEGKVAERLCGFIPSAEQVKFVKTGSEATAAAIRIARAATGRTGVMGIRGHYHGWHDWWAVSAPKHPGVPEYMVDGLAVAQDFEAALDLWEFYGGLAAVIVEPERVEMDRPGGLRKLIEKAHASGTLVIFDEMLSGGRLALGGAQEYYGVAPDLSTFGKAFGGGLPLAFVCGNAGLMKHAWPVSGTFSGDALALAACDAMLDVYEEEHVIEKLWSRGEVVRQGLLDAAEIEGLAIVVHGHSPRFWFEFPQGVDQRMAKSVFVQECRTRGLLVHPAVMFASAALTARDLVMSTSAVASALHEVAIGIKQGNLEARLDGTPYEDSVR